ncbi:AbrB/MazE/SpoVT family DNA-binding domain-containing protein [Paenibacillus polymyxa]|uniref:AbrB/MazE/SpoVT family DNA-binding domain-containing protein n=1 Tax=Paenibacillus polymyxa TaxID=1406 RepID=UPI002AB36492|nr:AbrB/MazE/SpoVT family DNA-binding domain-containing protein [Paenibacillus polymyxa]MDY7991290.1 AbrB/MazE/SpoVT family DNA-binding domain-containing protein [Paenibacillus polymyxa]MDY8117730.1 AbrB/MazE/SpoVT family DNA-binding domain-containing protein [Paenibacillus polymyxa]
MNDAIMKRNLDSLGRVVIPAEIRNRLGLNKNTEMEFFITESAIVLRRSESESCLLCGGNKQLIRFKKSYVCIYCANRLKGNPIAENQLPSTSEDIQNLSDAQMVKLLMSLMKQYPGASMKTYAQLLKISPTYVSLLKSKATEIDPLK